MLIEFSQKVEQSQFIHDAKEKASIAATRTKEAAQKASEQTKIMAHKVEFFFYFFIFILFFYFLFFIFYFLLFFYFLFFYFFYYYFIMDPQTQPLEKFP